MIFKRKLILVILSSLLLFNVWLIVTGKVYFYKALVYNFADVDDYKIFANNTISKSETPLPWKISSEYNNPPISQKLQQELDELESIAFLMIKDGEIAYEHYWNGYDLNTISGSFSMAKSVVSLLVGIAIDEGKIKHITDPITTYLPPQFGNEFSHITIQHLLTMSSGLNWDESYSNPFSMTTEAYYGYDLTSLMSTLKPESKAGIRFRYKSGDTQLLGIILQQATQMSLSEYASVKLWQPLGAEHDALWSTDNETGLEKAYCCINATARDFARIGQLVLQNGNWQNSQLIPENYLQKAQSACMLLDNDAENVTYYGYQWWLIPAYKGHDITYARGILGQYIIIIPNLNVVMVRLGKKRGNHFQNHVNEVFSMIDEAIERWGNIN